jgi:uncharacterized membrane protein HdeD (DUF308 family)
MDVAFLERRRTGWDIILGALLVIVGLIVLGNAALATAVSVYFLGWLALISGVVLFVASLFRIKSGGFWSVALGGAVLAVLGLFILRNPLVGAATLTLLAGSLFLVSGLVRVLVSFQLPSMRWPLIVSGLASMVLGLIVLLNLASATLALLGILLGIQTLLEGLTVMIFGRWRPVEVEVGAREDTVA